MTSQKEFGISWSQLTSSLHHFDIFFRRVGRFFSPTRNGRCLKWLDDLEFGAIRLRVGKLQVNQNNSPGMITISKNFSRRESLQICHGKSCEIIEIMLGKYDKIWCYPIYQICSSISSLRFKKTTPFSDPVMSWWGRIPEDHEKTVFFSAEIVLFFVAEFFTIQHSKLLKSKNWLMKFLVVPEIRLKSSNNPCQILMDCFLEVKLPQSQCFCTVDEHPSNSAHIQVHSQLLFRAIPSNPAQLWTTKSISLGWSSDFGFYPLVI